MGACGGKDRAAGADAKPRPAEEWPAAAVPKGAAAFFEACETGKGWDACKQYCADGAQFAGQADALKEHQTVESYTDWMKGLVSGPMPDAKYAIHYQGFDEGRRTACFIATFTGTNTGPGPAPEPTQKSTVTHYLYSLHLDGAGKVDAMTKVWNDAWALRQLGWAEGEAAGPPAPVLCATGKVVKAVADQYFESCETGKGWEACKQYCAPEAGFVAQAEPCVGMSLEGYTDWMKGLATTTMPDCSYELHHAGADKEHGTACFFATFKGTHTGEGGPVPATQKQLASEYAYLLHFNASGKIDQHVKLWNASWAMKQAGWM